MMKTEDLKIAILAAFGEPSRRLICSAALRELSEAEKDLLYSFHLRELYLIKMDDASFCGMRATHFCVEYGYSEDCITDGRMDSLALITANDKGARRMTLLRIDAGFYDFANV